MAAASREPAQLGRNVEQLIQAARRGSEQALGELLEGFRLLLLAEANHALPQGLRAKQAPSDLVQKTFLEALRDFRQFRGLRSEELKEWFRSILRRNVLNAARAFRAGKRDLKKEVPFDLGDSSAPGWEMLAADTQSPSGLAGQHEEEALLLHALQRLPAEDQLVIRLHHQESKSYAEVGKLMNITEGAAQRRFSRAIEKLQHAWEQLQREPRGPAPEPRS